MPALFSKKDDKKNEPEEQPRPVAGGEVRRRGRTAEFATLFIRAHITEKATRQAESNAYVFVVRSDAVKPRIRHAIENKYGVHVAKVNIVNIHGRKASKKRTSGFRSGFKKAIVTLREGEKIELG